ncbi:MAG: class I SAM-dependent methyltransferase [Nanoarchaeota archaeon]|nr:class I SAM-dependent methyltransferase [Nanoarchaeota archaeon]
MNLENLTSKLKLSIPLIYGATLSYDRWRWIKRVLPKNEKNKLAIDFGCGKGTYIFALSKRGYNSTGLTHDANDLKEILLRKKRFRINNCSFKKVDLRKLDQENSLKNSFDVAICSEVIEHIIKDDKLIKDISNTLRKDGLLLLTTPYYKNSHIDSGVILGVKEGLHVREGYNKISLKKLIEKNNLTVEHFEYCSGILSCKANNLLNILSKRNYILSRLVILPFKIGYPLFDKLLTNIFKKDFSTICVIARKNN